MTLPPPWMPPFITRIHSGVRCSPSLDRPAGLFQGVSGQGGPWAADRFRSAIGGLLPIALCGRSSL